MNLRRLLAPIAVAVASATLAAAPARASYVISFGSTTPTTIAVGQGFDVQVFLAENPPDGTLAANGLDGAGLVLTFNTTPAAGSPAQVTSITVNPNVDPSNDIVSTGITPASSGSAGTATLKFGLISSPALRPASGSSQILLGTFHLVAGNTVGQVINLGTMVAPTMPGQSGGQFVDGNGTSLDGQTSGSTATVTVVSAAVPEPSSIALAGLGAIGLVAARRRRRARVA